MIWKKNFRKKSSFLFINDWNVPVPFGTPCIRITWAENVSNIIFMSVTVRHKNVSFVIEVVRALKRVFPWEIYLVACQFSLFVKCKQRIEENKCKSWNVNIALRMISGSLKVKIHCATFRKTICSNRYR